MLDFQQLVLGFAEVVNDNCDDGFPCVDGKWLHISTTRNPSYVSMTLKHRSFKSAIVRALTLLNESPAFYESTEVKVVRNQ